MKRLLSAVLAAALLPLAASAEPQNQARHPSQTQPAQLRDMMLHLQVMTETYQIYHEGYPASVQALQADGQAHQYWFKNLSRRSQGVTTRLTPMPLPYLDAPAADGQATAVAIEPAKAPQGTVYYRASIDRKTYCIFALDAQGELLLNARGDKFSLTSADDDSLCRLR